MPLIALCVGVAVSIISPFAIRLSARSHLNGQLDALMRLERTLAVTQAFLGIVNKPEPGARHQSALAEKKTSQ